MWTTCEGMTDSVNVPQGGQMNNKRWWVRNTRRWFDKTTQGASLLPKISPFVPHIYVLDDDTTSSLFVDSNDGTFNMFDWMLMVENHRWQNNPGWWELWGCNRFKGSSSMFKAMFNGRPMMCDFWPPMAITVSCHPLANHGLKGEPINRWVVASS